MTSQQTFLVFGATGKTGQHFTSIALADGHHVRALARNPSKLEQRSGLQIQQGSITDPLDLSQLLAGIDAVVCLLGDAAAQASTQINTAFIRRLVPAMRSAGVPRLLYQAGGLSAPPDRRLPLALRAVRKTLARSYEGQHQDNEAVMRYLRDDASDLDWVVHRAGIGSDGPSRGALHRTRRVPSIATFQDVASYNYRLLLDGSATHTCDLSSYRDPANEPAQS